MLVRAKAAADQAWIDDVLARHWGGGGQIAVHGQVFDARTLPALIAGEHEGLATFAIEQNGTSAELVTLNALAPRRGVGTALIEALVSQLAARAVPRLCLTTTNDNLDALRFYQRRGFHIIGVRQGAVDDARKVKPAIPLVGDYGIPLRDELDLVRIIIS
jgi:GNAT superfamily N-acetyltransferase